MDVATMLTVGLKNPVSINNVKILVIYLVPVDRMLYVNRSTTTVYVAAYLTSQEIQKCYAKGFFHHQSALQIFNVLQNTFVRVNDAFVCDISKKKN